MGKNPLIISANHQKPKFSLEVDIGPESLIRIYESGTREPHNDHTDRWKWQVRILHALLEKSFDKEFLSAQEVVDLYLPNPFEIENIRPIISGLRDILDGHGFSRTDVAPRRKATKKGKKLPTGWRWSGGKVEPGDLSYKAPELEPAQERKAEQRDPSQKDDANAEKPEPHLPENDPFQGVKENLSLASIFKNDSENTRFGNTYYTYYLRPLRALQDTLLKEPRRWSSFLKMDKIRKDFPELDSYNEENLVFIFNIYQALYGDITLKNIRYMGIYEYEDHYGIPFQSSTKRALRVFIGFLHEDVGLINHLIQQKDCEWLYLVADRPAFFSEVEIFHTLAKIMEYNYEIRDQSTWGPVSEPWVALEDFLFSFSKLLHSVNFTKCFKKSEARIENEEDLEEYLIRQYQKWESIPKNEKMLKPLEYFKYYRYFFPIQNLKYLIWPFHKTKGHWVDNSFAGLLSFFIVSATSIFSIICAYMMRDSYYYLFDSLDNIRKNSRLIESGYYDSFNWVHVVSSITILPLLFSLPLLFFIFKKPVSHSRFMFALLRRRKRTKYKAQDREGFVVKLGLIVREEADSDKKPRNNIKRHRFWLMYPYLKFEYIQEVIQKMKTAYEDVR